MSDSRISYEPGDDSVRAAQPPVSLAKNAPLAMPRDSLTTYRRPDVRDAMPRSTRYKSRSVTTLERPDTATGDSIYKYSSDEPSLPEVPTLYKTTDSRQYVEDKTMQGYDLPNGYRAESGEATTSSGPQDEVTMSTAREIFFIAIIAASHLMTHAALGQALAPLDIIAGDVHTRNPGEMSWFIAGYSLTVGTFILSAGRLGDVMGHKRIFCFGYLWLGIWSCFTGFSVYPQRQIFFDVCRAMQGIGPALLIPNGLALLGQAYTPGIRKNVVFSIYGAVAPMGFVIGATSGSFFAQLTWWPWAFWSYGLTAWALGAFAFAVIPRSLSHRPANPLGFDITGSILSIAGLVLISVAWNNAPIYGWSTPHVYFVLIIGLLCLIAFIWVEKRALNPIIPVQAFNGTTGFVLTCVGVGWASFGIWLFYMIRWLHILRDATPLSISAQFSPAVVSGFVAAGLTGFMLARSPVSFVLLASMVAFCTGTVIAATMPAQQVYWAQTFVSIVLIPFGMDMSFPAATVLLSNHMPREHQGLAASLVNTVVYFSISVALGIAGTVEVGVVGDGTDLDSTKEERGLRAALLTAMGLSIAGVLLGAMFFIRSLLKDGWTAK